MRFFTLIRYCRVLLKAVVRGGIVMSDLKKCRKGGLGCGFQKLAGLGELESTLVMS